MKRLLAITAALILLSCSAAQRHDDTAKGQDLMEGKYSLVVLETEEGKDGMAVLDLEDDSYELRPEGVREKARKTGLSRSEAISLADESLPGSGVVLKSIKAKDKTIVGYEIYPPLVITSPDTGSELEILPNLLSIEYGKDIEGKGRFKLKVLPLKP